MLFADDTQLYITCRHYSEVQSQIEDCVSEIRSWMRSNLLVLNDSKTEVIHFVSKFKKSDRIPSVEIGDSSITPAKSVRNLGVKFDEAGLMTDQIKKVSKSASYGLWKIGKIRKFLDRPLTEKTCSRIYIVAP